MALGWLTVLKTVPWTEVIGNAPAVADGARKLWNAVGNKAANPPREAATPHASGGGAVDAQALSALEGRLHASEQAVAELHQQMRASSELLRALADQNTELVKAVEAQRARIAQLTAGCLLAGLVALGSLVLAWSGAA